jgi:hypothetical protein
MPSLRSRRVTALVTIGALSAGTAVAASPAQAGLLDGIVPNVASLVTGTGATLGGLVPGAGGVITGVTGTVGGVIGGVQDSVAGTVDDALGGILGGGGGTLPDDVVGSLLGTLLANSTAAPGTPGFGGPGAGGPIVLSGGTVGPGGQVILDASAPRSTVKVLSKLKQVGRTGKMKLQIKTNEPGIVALKSNVRPGAKLKAKKGAAAVKVSRKLIKIPQIVLGYRKAGTLTVTVRVSRAAQRTLNKVKDARMSVGTIAVDVWKNQDSENTKLKLKR